MGKKFSVTIYLLLLMSLGYIASDVYLPSLPALSVYFGTSDREIQMTLFSYLLSYSFIPLISGPLSDHVGRKKMLLGGITLTFFATLGIIFSPNITWFIILRFVQGIGSGTVMICARATTSDLFTGKELAKQMAFVTMLMPIVLGVSPTIGGMLQQMFGWQAVFLFLLLYVVSIFMCILCKSETLQTPKETTGIQIFSLYRSHLKNPLFLLFCVNFSLPSFGLFGYLTVSPFLFQEVIGLSPLAYGSLALYVAGAILISGYANFRLIHYFSTTYLLYFGSGLIIASGSFLLFFHMMHLLTIWSLLLPSLLYFTCIPFCVVNTAAKAMQLIKSQFGAAAALLTTFQFLVGAIGTFVFSHFSNQTILPLAICFIFVGILFLINLKYAQKLEVSAQMEIKS